MPQSKRGRWKETLFDIVSSLVVWLVVVLVTSASTGNRVLMFAVGGILFVSTILLRDTIKHGRAAGRRDEQPQ